MSKRVRQYIGILAALAAYYVIHEGAHLLYALLTGVFRQINFMGLGVQIDVYTERLTNTQLGIFCLAGALATLCTGHLLSAFAKRICRAKSKLLRASLYYITIALLLFDPLYLRQYRTIASAILSRLFAPLPQFQKWEIHTVFLHFRNFELGQKFWPRLLAELCGVALSVLCGFFGGGDMNGISLLCPELPARCLFGALLLANGLVFWKHVLPAYKRSFSR